MKRDFKVACTLHLVPTAWNSVGDRGYLGFPFLHGLLQRQRCDQARAVRSSRASPEYGWIGVRLDLTSMHLEFEDGLLQPLSTFKSLVASPPRTLQSQMRALRSMGPGSADAFDATAAAAAAAGPGQRGHIPLWIPAHARSNSANRFVLAIISPGFGGACMEDFRVQ